MAKIKLTPDQKRERKKRKEAKARNVALNDMQQDRKRMKLVLQMFESWDEHGGAVTQAAKVVQRMNHMLGNRAGTLHSPAIEAMRNWTSVKDVERNVCEMAVTQEAALDAGTVGATLAGRVYVCHERSRTVEIAAHSWFMATLGNPMTRFSAVIEGFVKGRGLTERTGVGCVFVTGLQLIETSAVMVVMRADNGDIGYFLASPSGWIPVAEVGAESILLSTALHTLVEEELDPDLPLRVALALLNPQDRLEIHELDPAEVSRISSLINDAATGFATEVDLLVGKALADRDRLERRHAQQMADSQGQMNAKVQELEGQVAELRQQNRQLAARGAPQGPGVTGQATKRQQESLSLRIGQLLGLEGLDV